MYFNVHLSLERAYLQPTLLQKCCSGAWVTRWHWLGGVEGVTVSEFLGHSSIEMTLGDAHPSSENKRRAVQCLDRHYLDTNSKSTAQRDSARLLNLHFMRP